MPQERVESPLPGKILRVVASVGNHINEGDTICVIESMKMENLIVAPVSGKIKELNVAPEQVVQSSDLLAIIEY
jgi:biotin carboxyl carrier protein